MKEYQVSIPRIICFKKLAHFTVENYVVCYCKTCQLFGKFANLTPDRGKKNREEVQTRSNAFSSPHIYDQTSNIADEVEEHIGKQWNTDGGNEWEQTNAK